ncbi:MAG TPA: hypothetical protein VNE86_04180 [Nitrososphaerales archaeon]|nr:hypothetical protein [Nitrososphaerales archaeon]
MQQELFQKFKELEGCYSYLHMTSEESEVEYAQKKDIMDSDCERALTSGNYRLVQVNCYEDAAQRNKRLAVKLKSSY